MAPGSVRLSACAAPPRPHQGVRFDFHVRIDSRLIHGQVVEAWLPALKVARVVVADDEAAESPLMRAAMGLAVPPGVEVDIGPLDGVPFARLEKDAVPTLLLLRDVAHPVARPYLGPAAAPPQPRQRPPWSRSPPGVDLGVPERRGVGAADARCQRGRRRGGPRGAGRAGHSFAEMVERFEKG